MKLRVLEGKNILFIEVNAFYQFLCLCTVARQLLYAIGVCQLKSMMHIRVGKVVVSKLNLDLITCIMLMPLGANRLKPVVIDTVQAHSKTEVIQGMD